MRSSDRVNLYFAILGVLVVLGAIGFILYEKQIQRTETEAPAVYPGSAGASSGQGASGSAPEPSPLKPLVGAPSYDPVSRLRIEAATHPEDPLVWMQLASELRKQKRYEEAAPAYEMALRLVPDDFFLNVSHRMFLIESGEGKGLRDKLEQMEEDGTPLGPDWQIVKAVFLSKEGQFMEGSKLWDSATSDLPIKLLRALESDPLLTQF